MKKFIFILIIFLFGIRGVKAFNSNLEFIDGVRYTMSINDPNLNYYHAYNQAYIKIDGNLVYCLDPTKIIIDGLNYSEESSSLSSNENIKLIGHYGYNYYYHNNYRYYLAAQELIWQIIKPSIDINWFNKDIKLDLSKEKEEIMYLVNNHLSKPSFDNQTFNLKQYEELILEDNLLSLYDVISINKSIVRREGNKLIINKVGTSNEQIVLKKRIKYDYLETKYFISDNYQNLILPRVNDEVISVINLENNYGGISISKVDSESGLMSGYQDASLKGSKYNLYDINMNLIKEFTYDKDYYTIKNLLFGTYYLQEIENSNGYLKDDTIHTIIIDENNRYVNLTLKSELIKAKLVINNLYGDLRTKEDSIFMINDIKMDVKDGIGEIELRYGKYMVKQVSAIKNHTLSDEFTIEVKDTNNLEYTIINEEIKGSINVSSVDSLNGIIDEKFIYKLFSIDKNEYIKINNSEYLITNNGVLNINNLSLGNYIIEYSDSLPQYDPIETTLTFELNGNNSLNFKYQEAYESLNVNVLDNLKEEIENSSFNLYCNEDIYFNKKVICLKDELINTFNMVSYNIIVPNLLKGKYYVLQTKVDNKYILNTNKHYIDIAVDNKVTIINNLKIEDKIETNNGISGQIDNPINQELDEEVIDNKDFYSNQESIENDDIIYNNEEYIKIPNTGIKVFKINGLLALLIIVIGYIVVRYAKE